MCLLAITSSKQGIRERNLGAFGDTSALELADRGGDHRVEVGEVTWGVGDLRGDHDLSLINDGLGVVALHVAEVRFHPLAVRVTDAEHIVGQLRCRPRVRALAKPAALRVASGRPVVLIGTVGRELRVTLLL
ncbi:MAG TPA: hypothetical protein VG405_11255 [Solirubrobacteraceae bacterium]|jgi:hypothetical protein|nr:hypothetical protein [Solirubrobacteraceae bacterium]